MSGQQPTQLGRSRLRVVGDVEAGALEYDEANAEFHRRWALAREAHGKILMRIASLSHPLFIATGGATRARADDALWQAQEMARESAVLVEHLAAARGVFERSKPKEEPT